MKKTYRNALRSRTMIRQAFLELLEEKALDKITVVDIVQRADLSRNTFYAHYPDVNAVLQEFQQQTLEDVSRILDQGADSRDSDQMLRVLQEVAAYFEQNKTTYRALLHAPCTSGGMLNAQNLFVRRVWESIPAERIRDPRGLEVFLGVVAGGAFSLLRQYLSDETDLSTEEIFTEVHYIFCEGMPRFCTFA